MIVDCISDLHGEPVYPEGGDLLIVAGDLTLQDTETEYDDFWRWLSYQNYKKKVIIAGNYDSFLQNNPDYFKDSGEDIEYLCDSGTEFEGLKIWGSPWTAKFQGINPNCCAFTVDHDDEDHDKEDLLEVYWKKIPADTDILITHCPPFGILDTVSRPPYFENTGSLSLRHHIVTRINPKLHVFGHIHRWGGNKLDIGSTTFINASIMNEDYDALNKPVRIKL